MTYHIDMDAEDQNFLRHLAPLRKQRIKQALRLIAKEPLLGKPLEEDLAGYFSYRVGTFRIIYSVNKTQKIIHVVAMGPRRNIYKDLQRELWRQHHTKKN